MIIDNTFRSSDTDARRAALIYGEFHESPTMQSLVINGAFGCNGAHPQLSAQLPNPASDFASATLLANGIRDALILNGMAR